MLITQATIEKIKSNLPRGASFIDAKYTTKKRDNHVNKHYIYHNVEVRYMYRDEVCRTLFAKKGGYVR